MTTSPSFLMIAIDMRSYWHPGTGRAGGDDTDAAIDKDETGLPIVRGRHIKGLLREAAERLRDDWQAPGWDDATINLLFGREAWEADGKRSAQLSAPGCIRFGNARLPCSIVAEARKNSAFANHFIARLASTRIEFSTGAAQDKTLRSMEVAVPLKLEARLDWAPADRCATRPLEYGEEDAEGAVAIRELSQRWEALMKECLPFVVAIGAHRNRGFGRALLNSGASSHA